MKDRHQKDWCRWCGDDLPPPGFRQRRGSRKFCGKPCQNAYLYDVKRERQKLLRQAAKQSGTALVPGE